MAKVEIYTTQTCGFCHAAKRLLKGKGVSFMEIDIRAKPARRDQMIQRAKGRSTVPQIFIDGAHVGGCDDLFALEHGGKLDRMLGR